MRAKHLDSSVFVTALCLKLKMAALFFSHSGSSHESHCEDSNMFFFCLFESQDILGGHLMSTHKRLHKEAGISVHVSACEVGVDMASNGDLLTS